MKTTTDNKVKLTVNSDDYDRCVIKTPKPVGYLRFEELQTVLMVYRKLSRMQKWAFKFFFNAKYTTKL